MPVRHNRASRKAAVSCATLRLMERDKGSALLVALSITKHSAMIQYLSSYVRPMRKQLGLTQSELGKLIGEQSQSCVARFERGDRYPSFESLIALRSILNCSIERMFPKAIEDIQEANIMNVKSLIADLNLSPQDKARDFKLSQLGVVLERLEAQIATGEHGEA